MDIFNHNKSFEKKYGWFPTSQKTESWQRVKLGVLSASNASKIVAKKDSETRLTYMCDLVAQIATKEFEEINSKYLDWGNAHESAARASYKFEKECELLEVPFIFADENFRVGVSPDGLVLDESGLFILKSVEIKCPYNPSHFIKFSTEEKIKTEYEWQHQFQMYAMKLEESDFAQYYPNLPFKSVPFKIDEKKQTTLKDAIPQFIHDMDLMLDKLELKFGSQWSNYAPQD